MKLAGYVLAACLVLVVLRAAILLAALAFLLFVTVELVKAPKRTLSLLTAWLLLNVFAAYPQLGLVLMLAVLLTGALAR